MEGFKSNPKMRSDIACYKEGGSVGYKSRHSEKTEMKEDVAQDKAMVKKGVAQHEAAKHKGEPKTELKLKTGGRCKKEGGKVRKYKAGGSCKKADGGVVEKSTTAPKPDPLSDEAIAEVGRRRGYIRKAEGGSAKKPKADAAIGMKKTVEDKKSISVIKQKAAAPKKKAPKTEGLEVMDIEDFPQFAEGGMIDRLRNNLMGTPEQNAAAEAALANRYGNAPGMMGDVERAINPRLNKRPKPKAQMPVGAGSMSDADAEMMQGLRAIGRAMGGKV